jgi:hypothetical protein
MNFGERLGREAVSQGDTTCACQTSSAVGLSMEGCRGAGRVRRSVLKPDMSDDATNKRESRDVKATNRAEVDFESHTRDQVWYGHWVSQ